MYDRHRTEPSWWTWKSDGSHAYLADVWYSGVPMSVFLSSPASLCCESVVTCAGCVLSAICCTGSPSPF